MWTRFSNWLIEVSRGWVALLALVVFALFLALVLPAQAARAEVETGGAGSPDGSFFYTAADLYELAEAYGPTGRQAYIRARWTFDVVWPLVYTFFLATTISWVSRRAFSAGTLGRRANLVPVGGALFDFLENGAASLVMARYPETTPVVDSLATVFTMIKWILVNGSFVVLAAVLIVWLIRRRRPERP